MVATSFWSPDGKPISAEEFLQNLYGILPDYFKDEEELRTIWSTPSTRKALLESLSSAGFEKDELTILQSLVDAENSDIFDVLEYVSFARKPISREERVAFAQTDIYTDLNNRHKEFIDFVLSRYIETGVDELGQDKLPSLLQLKYQSLTDALERLGDVNSIQKAFIDFQKHLYGIRVA